MLTREIAMVWMTSSLDAFVRVRMVRICSSVWGMVESDMD